MHLNTMHFLPHQRKMHSIEHLTDSASPSSSTMPTQPAYTSTSSCWPALSRYEIFFFFFPSCSTSLADQGISYYLGEGAVGGDACLKNKPKCVHTCIGLFCQRVICQVVFCWAGGGGGGEGCPQCPFVSLHAPVFTHNL